MNDLSNVFIHNEIKLVSRKNIVALDKSID